MQASGYPPCGNAANSQTAATERHMVVVGGRELAWEGHIGEDRGWCMYSEKCPMRIHDLFCKILKNKSHFKISSGTTEVWADSYLATLRPG